LRFEGALIRRKKKYSSAWARTTSLQINSLTVWLLVGFLCAWVRWKTYRATNCATEDVVVFFLTLISLFKFIAVR